MATTTADLATGAQSWITYIEETAWGTTPGTPAMKKLRNRGSNLELTRAQFESKELRNDRAIADFRLGNHETQGDIECEIIPGAMDDMLAGAFMGAWNTNTLKSGTTFTSFSIEAGFTDESLYHLYTGMVVDKAQFSIKPGDIATVKFSFKGKTMVASGTSADSSPTEAVTTAPCDAFSGTISEGGSPSGIITGLDFTVDNQCSSAPVIGSLYPYGIMPGRCKVTGTLSAIFASNALLTKFIAETASSLTVVLKGIPDTKTYTISIPNIKYIGGKVDVNKEQDLVVTLPFQAIYNSGTTTTIQVDRAI